MAVTQGGPGVDADNPVIRLCVDGSRAEFEGRFADACALYAQAWELASNDYEACIAAHYVARCQDTPEQTLRWDQEALQRADAVGDETVAAFYPSLYLNLGRSYERVGDEEEARRYYGLAAEFNSAANGRNMLKHV